MSEWQPIETAPDDDVLIGAYYDSGKWDAQVGYQVQTSGKARWRPFVGQTGQPTHWMPIPPPPCPRS